MTTITNKDIIQSLTRTINSQQRHFKRDAKGHPKGSGLEIVAKTSKLNPKGDMVVWHTLKDGRRMCVSISVK